MKKIKKIFNISIILISMNLLSIDNNLNKENKNVIKKSNPYEQKKERIKILKKIKEKEKFFQEKNKRMRLMELDLISIQKQYKCLKKTKNMNDIYKCDKKLIDMQLEATMELQQIENKDLLFDIEKIRWKR